MEGSNGSVRGGTKLGASVVAGRGEAVEGR